MEKINVAIAGTGMDHPEDAVSNAELVTSFNAYIDRYREQNKRAIEEGKLSALAYSDEAFIQKASGIASRYMIDKKSVLDPDVMMARVPRASSDDMSLQCRMAKAASEEAMTSAGVTASDVDAVIVACSNLQRAYPAVAIELQAVLGIEGMAFDMNVACASAVFALQQAVCMIKQGLARAVLVCSPELCTAHLNFRDRQSHFIFGDAASAMLVQREDLVKVKRAWRVEDTACKTRFSKSICNDFSFLSRAWPESWDDPEQSFKQDGPKVFKDVVPWVSAALLAQCARLGMEGKDLGRLWLHQANANMNRLIAKKVLGHDASEQEAPSILTRFGNTSSSGSIIAMHLSQADAPVGTQALLAAFGAGYSSGSAVLRCVAP
jgi:beta-ketodecanoyl-[acyl-carrier-protein] synthase